MNGRYMRELPLEEYEQRLAEHLRSRAADDAPAFEAASPELRRTACAIVQDKAQTLDEAWPLIRFLFREPVDDPKAWDKVMKPEVREALSGAADVLRGADGFDAEALEVALGEMVERLGAKPKNVYQPIRVAITGTTVSPGIFDSLAALGRDESVRRIEAALERLPA
jgi:glutamyl-tRNA synthetase